MKFRARVDAIYICIYLLNLLVGAICGILLFSIDINFMVILFSVLLGIEIVIVSFMIVNCYYIIEESTLKLVIGFVSLTIKIRDIREIKFSKNMAFSFALARQRIELKLGDSDRKKFNRVYISPKDSENFILLLSQNIKGEEGGNNEIK